MKKEDVYRELEAFVDCVDAAEFAYQLNLFVLESMPTELLRESHYANPMLRNLYWLHRLLKVIGEQQSLTK